MGKKGEKQFRWTKPMEYLMLEILADEVKQGNKSTTQFKAISFNRVAEAINQRLGVECSPKHVENHLKTIKNTWNTVQTLLNKSGLGWNDNYKMITASPSVYAAYIQILYAGDNCIYPSKEIEVEDIVSETPQVKTSRKRSRSDMQDMFVDVSSKLGEVATAISRIADTRLDVKKLHEEVMSTEGYEEAFLSEAVDFLVERDPLAKAFMVKSQALRKLWLDKFKREHYDTQ